jgi:hypothetical protein
MKVAKTKNKLILLLIAFAVGWFSLYSIINFHQHRIFGKELKYNVYPSLCKKEESFIPAFLKQKDTKTDNNTQFEIQKLYAEQSHLTIIYKDYTSQTLFLSELTPCQFLRNSQKNLRGPPSVS